MGSQFRRLEERPVTTVVLSLPESTRPLFEEVVGAHDPRLLGDLKTVDEASRAQRIAVERILSDEFSHELGADYEPTDRGRQIDTLLGQFLLRWPIEAE